jgi:hypothetical protein
MANPRMTLLDLLTTAGVKSESTGIAATSSTLMCRLRGLQSPLPGTGRPGPAACNRVQSSRRGFGARLLPVRGRRRPRHSHSAPTSGRYPGSSQRSWPCH